ncbi:MAG: S8 family serine peptidase [Candidatus Nitrosocosmicus sp.]|nr:S8 family serine peptidase [Candidatus Nitrosocosmicus sp.]MDN5866784.1 S8 family serine peptidase [Candidatus Nitrosocosmicus sp.]
MVNFPDEILYPSGNKIYIDRKKWLVGLKVPYTISTITNKLSQFSVTLESPLNPSEVINNTSNNFWVQTAEIFTEGDIIGTLQNAFGPDFDWVGPVYSNPDIPGQKGLLCPLPNVLIITFTSLASIDEPSISQDLQNTFSMKRSLEKSQYSGVNTHYYVIQDTINYDAYQIKTALDPKTDVYSSIRFEHMPMIVPISHVPNDLLFTSQWNMIRIRAGGEGTTAWDLSIGSEDVVICVIDTGCDLNHPDLKFASSGLNLDSMLANGSPIEGPQLGDNIGHGTAVAGIIAATINNSLGVAGVAGDCKILPLAFVRWTEEELIRGINFAKISKVRVINMSISFDIPDVTAVEQALSEASVESLICASTGNTNSSTVSYPARSKYVMACGASDQDDNRQSPSSPVLWGSTLTGSNFGPQMSVVAPGISIPTTDIVGPLGYSFTGDSILGFQGTSAAVPHLSGLAGLLFSVHPTLSPEEARIIIERTADKVGTLPYTHDLSHQHGTWNVEMGYGRINALRAVIAAAQFNPDLPWYREVVLAGTMVLHDYEPDIIATVPDEEKTSVFSVSGIPTTWQVGPFQTHVDIPAWIDKVGGEVRGEVRLALDWKTDSSIDVNFNIKLYEGTSEETDDLDGELTGTLNIPKNTTGLITEKVMNTAEDSEDFIQLSMTIANNQRP